MKNRILVLSIIMTASMLCLCACGSGSTANNITSAYAPDYDYAATESFATDFKGDWNAEMEEAATEHKTNTDSKVTANRKLVKTVNMNVETENFDPLIENVKQKVINLGGYLESFSTNGNRNYRNSSMTARIPKDNLDAFLEMIEGASNITYRNETVEDVTLKYVDLESHKKMLEKERGRLMEFMSSAENLEDILVIEERLTEVQYQLESMESQIRTFDNKIDYSTVYLEINEVERYTPPVKKGTWERISTGFTENLYSVGNGIKNFFIEFVIAIPILLVYVVIIGLIIVIVKVIIKRKKKKATVTYNSTPQNMALNNIPNVTQNVNNTDEKNK